MRTQKRNDGYREDSGPPLNSPAYVASVRVDASCNLLLLSHANIRYRAEVATDFSDGGDREGGHRAKQADFLLPCAVLQPTRALALTLLSQFQN